MVHAIWHGWSPGLVGPVLDPPGILELPPHFYMLLFPILLLFVPLGGEEDENAGKLEMGVSAILVSPLKPPLITLSPFPSAAGSSH